MRKITIFMLLTFLLVLGAAPAYAQPALPHAFFGSVTVNDAAADDGTQVSATVDNGTVIPTQNPVATAGGNYGIDSLKLLVQGDGLSGAITFYVNDHEATPSKAVTFEAGGGPDRIDLSVTIAAPPPPPPPPAAGGGGGGPPPPSGTTDVRGLISYGCSFLMSVSAISEDGLCTLTIPAGTVGLTEELACVSIITMLIMDEPPPPPEGAHVIGLVYDFQPSGATFEPPITLTFSYDPADIPDGVAEEDLVLAYYDQATGEWVELEGTVDPQRNTITASISHLTAFTIIGAVPLPPPPPPVPAAFSVSNLSVKPAQVQPKEAVTIAVSVANTGGTEGSYSLVLEINGVKEAEKSVTVAAGSSRDITFSVTREKAASYSVAVDGLSASFTVVAPPALPPAAPPEVKPPVNWPLVGGIIAAVVVVALLGFFWIRRRAH